MVEQGHKCQFSCIKANHKIVSRRFIAKIIHRGKNTFFLCMYHEGVRQIVRGNHNLLAFSKGTLVILNHQIYIILLLLVFFFPDTTMNMPRVNLSW